MLALLVRILMNRKKLNGGVFLLLWCGICKQVKRLHLFCKVALTFVSRNI